VIYLHVPFCHSFCTYCDFYSEICSGERSRQVQNRYLEDVLSEISRRSGEIKESRTSGVSPDTLYIGGGTPSLLPAESFARIVDALGGSPFEEFTIEANPDDIVGKGVGYVRELMEIGVNRISLGVQSFDDGILRWMNRRHDAAGACRAVEIIHEAGLENVSLDLISGLSQLDDRTWEESILKAVSLGARHISAYDLSLEEGSALSEMVEQGRYEMASQEHCRRQYDILCRVLSEKGFRHYEISNFALPGFEAVHNSAYWRRVPYVGLGPGAHSFIFEDGVQKRRWNDQTLEGYGFEEEILDPDDVQTETVMLALRTDRGIVEDVLYRICGPDKVEKMLEEGLLEHSSGRIRIPERHFFVSDDIIGDLI